MEYYFSHGNPSLINLNFVKVYCVFIKHHTVLEKYSSVLSIIISVQGESFFLVEPNGQIPLRLDIPIP